MPQNPFETPLAPTVDPVLQRAMVPAGTFDVGRCLSDAWQATMGNIGLVIGVSVVGLIIGVLSELTIIGIFLLLPVLLWGGIYFVLNVLDGRAQFGDLFAGFSRYGQALGPTLAAIVCMFLLTMLGESVYFVGMFTGSTTLMFGGSLILLAWFFFVMLRFYFAFFFIVDQGMGGIDALKASWAVTSNQKLNTFVLALLSGVLVCAGIVALLVGVLIAIPLTYVMWASAYRQITGTAR